MAWVHAEERATLEKRLQAFSAEHDNLRVDLSVFPSAEECATAFESRCKRGCPPDVCMITATDAAKWSRSGCFSDLLPYRPDDSNFAPETLTAFSLSGRLYAIPCGWSALVLYYNRAIFERHGIPFPRSSWDWGDLLSAALALTVHDEDSDDIRQYGIELTPSVDLWAPFVWQNNGRLMREDKTWSLTDPQFLQSNQHAVEFYADLVREHHVAPPSGKAAERTDSGRLFLDQKAAMVFAHRELGRRLRYQRGLDWDIAVLPRSLQNASYLEVYGYAISSTSQRPEDAWKLVSFLSSETSQAAMTLNGAYAPARRSLLRSKLFLDFPGPHAVRNLTMLEALPSASPSPPTAMWNEASAILTEEMASLMISPNASARSALEQMQARLDELSLLRREQAK